VGPSSVVAVDLSGSQSSGSTFLTARLPNTGSGRREGSAINLEPRLLPHLQVLHPRSDRLIIHEIPDEYPALALAELAERGGQPGEAINLRAEAEPYVPLKRLNIGEVSGCKKHLAKARLNLLETRR
jgi:hypothetical protein